MYSSGNVGEIQGDAIRETDFATYGVKFNENSILDSRRLSEGVYNQSGLQVGKASYPAKLVGDYVSSAFNIYTSVTPQERPLSTSSSLGLKYHDYVFYGQPFHYYFEPEYSTFTTESGTIRYVSGLKAKKVPLEVEECFPVEYLRGDSMSASTAASSPTANEIRPVNVAVKFMIKAK